MQLCSLCFFCTVLYFLFQISTTWTLLKGNCFCKIKSHLRINICSNRSLLCEWQVLIEKTQTTIGLKNTNKGSTMEELLTCSVCCERYCENERQPVLLPRCGHSFCRPCVTLLLSAGCIICPTCRTDQRIEAAHRLPTEFTLLAIIAAQESSKVSYIAFGSVIA